MRPENLISELKRNSNLLVDQGYSNINYLFDQQFSGNQERAKSASTQTARACLIEFIQIVEFIVLGTIQTRALHFKVGRKNASTIAEQNIFFFGFSIQSFSFY